MHLGVSAIVMLNLRGWAPKRLLLIGDTVTVETEVPANRLTLRGDAGVSGFPCTLLIPTLDDQDPWAQSRSPMVVTRHG